MRTKTLVMAACAALVAVSARAQSPAASACPPYFFLSGNLAANPSFETPSPAGFRTVASIDWPSGTDAKCPGSAFAQSGSERISSDQVVT